MCILALSCIENDLAGISVVILHEIVTRNFILYDVLLKIAWHKGSDDTSIHSIC